MIDTFLYLNHPVSKLKALLKTLKRNEIIFKMKPNMYLFLFQLSELEQRVLEAEGRAEEAEDKVNGNCYF